MSTYQHKARWAAILAAAENELNRPPEGCHPDEAKRVSAQDIVDMVDEAGLIA